MFLLDLTLPTPEENLALDEALLDEAEQGDQPRETLRLWESTQPMVVLGRSSHLAVEVNELACRQCGIPVLRRASGGATVIAGPGCLMYALVLSYQLRPECRMIDVAHRTVMGTIRSALLPLVARIEFDGTCDLTLAGRKFSGNALRCRREHLLYHGTLLYNFPLALIAACLGTPARQPDYRAGRSHGEFVCNLPLNAAALRAALIGAWEAREPVLPPGHATIDALISEKHGRRDWVERY